jgi:hypothetical protein
MKRHISERLENNQFKVCEAEFAQFYDGKLRIRNSPYLGSYGDSLENIQYAIIDGILYIKGTTTEWDYYNEPISGWNTSLMSVHEVSQEWLDEHEVPDNLVKRNFKKRVWFFFHVTYKIVLDLRNTERTYFKRKETYKFEYGVHPFKLQEA